VVTNGREAVEAVLHTNYDVVLMDVQMPVMDGVQATRRIRALPAPANGVPIVALTADAVTGAEDRYRGAGMDAYLSKPLSPDTLMATLDSIVRGRQRPAAAPTVDRSAISGLRGFLNGAEFTAFIEESVRDLAVRIDGLGARVAGGELDLAARDAHDLVAVAGNCGAGAVSALARAVEQAARRGDAAEVGRLFAEMRGAGGQAAEALGELLGA
jgi:CheY-like chemotaxis protein